ncbi:MAG: YggS family pyridoxal phosphate-dependent enzyme [Chloroflexi bacterium]|jgi:pyridoxal phosphate enzyme (YggS family)|nr:YggS family pyridoxal phosphate-dependent enzyme [Chloroflexota bacterium]
MTDTTLIQENLQNVHERIGEAALRAGRDPDLIQLVAVSKTFPVEAVLVAWELGQRDFGENRPREGARKVQEVAAQLDLEAEARPTWHMIGHIQSRKTDIVAEHFDTVHSLDRMKIARRLSRLMVAAGGEMPVLIECNVSGEASKYGYDLADWQHEADVRAAFFDEVTALLELPGLRVQGLMTMAPLVEDPETVRPVFASLRALRGAMRERFPGVEWRHLSMGMTDDFEVAVEEGATMLRIGRAIFGQRPI